MMSEEHKHIHHSGHWTAQNVLQLGEEDSKFESPINLSTEIVSEVQLPSLQWSNASEKPRLMKITNSGHSVILSAKWFGPRPFISNGPFLGYYVFSQIHFHWGKNNNEGSEHTVDGSPLPLEMHVMFFKSLYLSQEEAMKKLDGVTVIAYLLKVHDSENAALKTIIDALDNIKYPFTSQHIELLSLNEMLPLFTDDYYFYWGNVINSHKVLWLICRQPLTVSAEQVAKFRKILDKTRKPMLNNFREVKSLNYRKLYHVNPGVEKGHILNLLPFEKIEENNDEAEILVEVKPRSSKKKSIKKKSIKKKSIKKVVSKQKVQQSANNPIVGYYKEDSFSNDDTVELNNESNIAASSQETNQSINKTYVIDNKLKLLEELVDTEINQKMTKKYFDVASPQKALINQVEANIPVLLNKVEKFLRNALHQVEEQTKDDDTNSINPSDALTLTESKEERIINKTMPITKGGLKKLKSGRESGEPEKKGKSINTTKNERTSEVKNKIMNRTARSDIKKELGRPKTTCLELNKIHEIAKPGIRRAITKSVERKRKDPLSSRSNKTLVKEMFQKNTRINIITNKDKIIHKKSGTTSEKNKRPVWKY